MDGPVPPTPVYGPPGLQIPSSTTTTLPRDVSGSSRKVVDPRAIAAQGDLADAKQAGLALENQTIPINDLPDDLLTPDEQEQRWSGGVNETIPSQLGPGEQGGNPTAEPLTMPTETGEPTPKGITRAELVDRVSTYKATQQQAMEAKLQREAAEREAAYQRQLQQSMEAFNATKAEAARLASPEVLFAKPSFGHRILSGIAQAFGAYGATLGRTENFAMQIIKSQQEQDMQMKRMALDAAMKSAERAGATTEAIMKMRGDGLKQIQEKRIEQNHWLDAQLGKMSALWPAEAQKVEKLRADVQAETAKDTRDFFAEHGGSTKTGTHYGMAVTQVEGSTAQQKQPQTVSDAEGKKATYGKQIVDAVDVVEKGRRLNDDEIKLLNENVMGMRSAAENATKGLFGPAKVKAMRALGLAPDSLTAGLEPEAKKVANAMLIGAGLIIRDQSGAAITNFEDLNNAMQRLPQIGYTDEMYADSIKGMRKYGESLVKLSGPVAQQRMGITPEGKDVPAGSQATAQKRPAPIVPAGPLTAKEVGKAIPNMPKDIQGRMREAMAVRKGSKDYAEAQQYLRSNVGKYRKADD